MDATDEFLAHFGVKGMKWGIRKDEHGGGDDGGIAGESISTPSKRQAKAAGFRAKAEEGKQQLADLKTNGMRSALMQRTYGANADGASGVLFFMSYGKTKAGALADAKNELTKKVDYNTKTADAYENGKLTPSQKKAIVGASVAIGAVVATGLLIAYGNKVAAKNALIDSRAITAEYGGGKISYEKFSKNVHTSIKKSWGNSEHVARVGATKLEDMDFHIPKGTEFTRISTTVEKSVKSGNYAAFLPEDVTRYRGTFVNEKAYASKLYNVKIHAQDDIKVPSLRKKVDTFASLLDEGGKDSVVSARSFLADKVVSSKEKEFIRTGPAHEVAEKYYHNVAGGNFSSDALSKMFANKIVSQGYHAIVDDMDAGVYGDKPMVLLDATMFKVASSSPLTKDMIDEARQNITEVIGRKY